MNLGRTSFERKLNYYRAAAIPGVALKQNFRLFSRPPYARDYNSTLSYYKQASTTARRNYKLYLAEEDLVASSFTAASLSGDDEAGAETLRDATTGAPRQILTDDVFADIQPVSAVWSSLPADLKSVVPSGAAGFVVKTWFADGMSPSSSGALHALPSSDPLAYYILYNPDAGLGTTRHMAIIQRYQYGGASTSYKDKAWLYEQNTSTHSWVEKQYQGLPSSLPTTALPIE
ncbi:MAG: hypothetical protein JWO82_1951 [Akkermansiaceae bacterium]|nr:hypothetical protein [Akkermansiaceae bacterium]